MKVRIDGGDDAGATRHDAGTTTTRGRGSGDKQGWRRGDDAAEDERTTTGGVPKCSA